MTSTMLDFATQLFNPLFAANAVDLMFRAGANIPVPTPTEDRLDNGVPQTTPTSNPLIPNPTDQVRKGNAPVSVTPDVLTRPNPLAPTSDEPAVLGPPQNIIPIGQDQVDEGEDPVSRRLFQGVQPPAPVETQRVSTPGAPRQPTGQFSNPLLALLLARVGQGGQGRQQPQVPSLNRLLR